MQIYCFVSNDDQLMLNGLNNRKTRNLVKTGYKLITDSFQDVILVKSSE